MTRLRRRLTDALLKWAILLRWHWLELWLLDRLVPDPERGRFAEPVEGERL